MSGAERLNSTLKYILVPVIAAVLLLLGTQVVWGSQHVKIIVDGVEINQDVPAYIDNSRTMVPVRLVSEALGSLVFWDGLEQRVLVKRVNAAVEMWINKKTALVNGEDKFMDTAAAIRDGRTMVPLRFLAETFGIAVSWEKESNSVSLRIPVVSPPPSEQTDPDHSDSIGGNDSLKVSLLPYPASALIMKDVVNVRPSPGTNNPWISQVKLGQRLPIVGEQDDWYQVSLPDGRTGWIARWLTAVVYSPQADPSMFTGKSVVIDPGHGLINVWGSSDPGAIGPSGVVERDVVMNISLMLGEILLKEGFTVIFTRHGNTSLTLNERANTACRVNADLLVSVHANASTNPLLSGTMTFHCQSREPGQEAVNQKRKLLASVIQAELLALLQREDKGVREANFLVLRESLVPAVLVETAFISNSVEEKLLASSQFQKLSAEAISRGIKNYFTTH
jgi:N-acetylmuramoyl-L-alanine amidase